MGIGTLGGENFQRHIAEIEQLIQHDSGLALGDILRGIKYRRAGVVPGPLDHARHHGSGYCTLAQVGMAASSVKPVVVTSSRGAMPTVAMAMVRNSARVTGRSGSKKLLPVEIGTDEDALLGQADGGLVGGIASISA